MGTENWLPGARSDILAMAKVWVKVISVRMSEWGIPPGEMTELQQLIDDAEAVLELVSGTVRSSEHTARCNTAFDALKAKMRYIKSHFLLEPPLTPADLYSLLLRPRDRIRTPIQIATSMVEADVAYPNPGMLELRRIWRLGEASADLRSEFKVQIRLGIEGGTEPYRIDKPPERAEELPHVQVTRRKKGEFFDLTGNSGKKAHLCMRWLNPDDEGGPWGPVISTFIP